MSSVSSATVLTSPTLSATFNPGATLSDGQAALAQTSTASSYLLTDPANTGDVFGLSFAANGQTTTLVNQSPPGATALPLLLTPMAPEEDSPTSAQASVQLGALLVSRTLTLSSDRSELTLTLRLTHRGSSPILSLRWLSCLNPAPDFSLDGSVVTRNAALSKPFPLVTASGTVSGRALGFGWNGIEQGTDNGVLPVMNLGFCGASPDPTTGLQGASPGPSDQALGALMTLDRLQPGEVVQVSLVLLVADSQQSLQGQWSNRYDQDSDGYTPFEGDCDDVQKTVHPGQPETCDALDNDCNGLTDDQTACFDDDLDGWTELEGDCRDELPQVHPGAAEGAPSANGLVPDGLDNDCDGQIDENTQATDDDRDGYTELAGDCNDQNASVFPTAQEVPYNGQDEDCDGTDVRDLDGDGFEASEVGGTDCHDDNVLLHPGVSDPDTMGSADGIDQDCDGRYDEDMVEPGDILINEVMYDPDHTSDRQGEYIELINTTDHAIDVRGWTLSNAAGQRHTIANTMETLALEPHGLLLLSNNGDEETNGTLHPAYVYQGLTLANSTDQLTLSVEGRTISVLTYGPDSGLPDPVGASLQRTPACVPAPADELTPCWCEALSPWLKGDSSLDRGSPDAPNAPCPFDALADSDGDGAAAISLGGTDCQDANASIFPGATELPYDGIDQDCDGQDLSDQDGDGYAGVEATAVHGTDCDDLNPLRNPRASEDGGSGTGLGNGIDDNCNGLIDDGCLDVDDDHDGYSELDGDCDDQHAEVFPSNPELEDGLDNDCDGMIDPTWRDADGDGYSPAEGDCEDQDPDISPVAIEVLDGVDQNCNGMTDEGSLSYDDDGDGYAENEGDCDDAHPEIHPGALDLCADGIDQNCDGDRPDCMPFGGGCSTIGVDPAPPPCGPQVVSWMSLMLVWLWQRRMSLHHPMKTQGEQ